MIAVCRLVAVLAALLMASVGVQASTLYKCASANGVDSIQSDPCPKGSTQVWKRDATPEAPPTPEQMAAQQARRDREAADARALSQVAGTARPDPVAMAPPTPAPIVAVPVVENPKGPCRRAHEFSADVRAKDWLEMRDDQLRRLDDWVAGECRESEESRLPVQK
jgi:hypothetical protein